MTARNLKKASEGKDLWFYYIKINGYDFRPIEAGLSKIARLLDLRISYIREHINLYLES